jgi:UDPglucose 6-dehydrogenase
MSDLSTHLAWDATTDPMDVAVIGTGHVGLITAVAMSVTGHRVVATDVDDDKIARLTEGEPHFYEPGLEEALERQLASGRLRFSSDPSMTVGDAEVVFICVGTPPRADGEANLLAMETAASMIARHARRSPVVVEKSTVPAGTADRVRQTMVRDSGGTHFEIVSNPEFLREGSALHDSLHPDRIVVGGESEHALSVMRRLYEPITSQGCRLIEVDRATAELAKHTSNAFLALKISFANALARLSERAGADVTAIVDVMGSDPRIGPAFLSAGLGYGGFCFPKDVAALERLSARLGYPFPLLGEVARLNDEAVEAVASMVEEALWNLEGKRIAILGLAFKPLTDDVRFSPALTLARILLERGAEVVGYDPRAIEEAEREVPEMRFAGDAYEAVDGAHCAVVATEWEEFLDLDLAAVRSRMTYPVIVDGRNLFDPAEMAAAGFSYYSVGRPAQPDGQVPLPSTLVS